MTALGCTGHSLRMVQRDRPDSAIAARMHMAHDNSMLCPTSPSAAGAKLGSMSLRSHLQLHTFVRAGDKVEPAMFTNLKIASVLVALVCVAVGCMTGSSSAVTAPLAKKCQALTAKAFPPQVPGNPAAGSAKGTGRSQRDYFNRCVASGGNMDNDTPTRRK
jgi:hypothetical protein